VVEGSITALPFENGEFDAITCGDVLYHLLEHAQALDEFRRCLRPGGVVALNVPAYRWLWSYHDDRVQSKHRFTRKEVLQLLISSGFTPIFSTYWNTLPFPLVVLRRKVFPPRTGESDVKLFPAPVEAMFNGAMALERGWNRLGGVLPFGSSVFAVARKPI
jgi:ubiquinone/menaquinone biosynthesis C-methylase UbiE